MEKWKDVVGYEGLYKISSRGRVLSYGKRKRTTVLRQCKNNFGYMQVKLCKNSIRKNTYIHRMVGESFIGPSNMFDHRDQNPKNNSLSNIRKCNKSTNGMNRGKRNGGTSQYMGVHFHKENRRWVAQIKGNRTGVSSYIGSFKTEVEAAKAYNIEAKALHGEFACLNLC